VKLLSKKEKKRLEDEEFERALAGLGVTATANGPTPAKEPATP